MQKGGLGLQPAGWLCNATRYDVHCGCSIRHKPVSLCNQMPPPYCCTRAGHGSEPRAPAALLRCAVMAMSTQAYNAFTEDQRKLMRKHVAALHHAPIDTLERIGGGGVR